MKLTALAHVGVWVVWALWAYCLTITVLSLLGFVAHHLRFKGPASAVLSIRNRVVPTSVRVILDTVFVAAVMAPALRASASIGHLPAGQAVTQLAPPSPSPTPLPALTPAHSPAPDGSTDRGATYTVTRGDTLSSVALADCGDASQWRAIAGANPQIKNPNLIHPGDQLAIPCAPGNGVDSRPAAVLHTVAEGESLYSIAAHYAPAGTSETEIAERSSQLFSANHNRVVGPYGERLDRPRFIEAGWTLVIPPSVSAPARITAPAPPAAATVPVVPAEPLPAVKPPVSAVTPAPVSPQAPAPAVPVVSPTTASALTPATNTTVAPVTNVRRSQGHGRTHGFPIEVPGGVVLAGSSAGLLLALRHRARARRLHEAHLDGTPVRLEPEGEILSTLRTSGLGPAFDGLGALAETVLQRWANANGGVVPKVLSCWEGEPTTFVLDVAADAPCPDLYEDEHVRVEFRPVGNRLAGLISDSAPAPIVRGMNALADGILVPVGSRNDSTLHAPLLGGHIAADGGEAPSLVAAMILAARARCLPDDLEVIVVGGALPPGFAETDSELVPVRHVSLGEQESVRLELEELLQTNATVIAGHQLQDLATHVITHPDDRVRASVLILPAGEVEAWVPLLTRSQGLGIGAVIVGDYRVAPRQLILNADGILYMEGEGIDRESLSPCLLPQPVLDELAPVADEEPPDNVEVPDTDWPPYEDPDDGDEQLQLVASKAVVHVGLFGTLRVTDARGERVAQPGRGRRATRDALAFLAAHPGWVDADQVRQALNKGDDLRSTHQDLYAAVSEARRWLLASWTSSNPGEVPPKGTELIAQQSGQGYRLATELGIEVDVAEFDRAWAAAKAHPESIAALRRMLATYTGTLLDPDRNSEAVAWVEKENLRTTQQSKVAWAALTLAEHLCAANRPREALDALEPLLAGILNEDLWLCALRCQGAAGPRGLDDRPGLIDLYGRYQALLSAATLPPPGPRAEELYRSLLSAAGARQTSTLDTSGVPPALVSEVNGNSPRRRLRLIRREAVR
ncbi:MAG TPA: LysM peptidoglycan-binding domain-containing protein [Actinomycetota bacterium]|nr:LysM peptidoglycan-binding domain-containing protein [Actinomycetota bacterium]